jgi:RNA polymerase sigma-70 factor, ECF subfamily
MNDQARALEAHYVELAPMLLAYFRRQRTLAASADDLLQETFLRAWRDWAKVQAAVSVRAYLFGIARHVSLDALRRLRPTEQIDALDIIDATPPIDERLAIVQAAIAALPDVHREPLWLKLQHDLSYAEIAEVLGIPVGTVRSRLHYAIQRLQTTVTLADSAAPRAL